MNTLVAVLANVCLIGASEMVLGFPGIQLREKVSNASCTIKHNLDGRLLQLFDVSDVVPAQGLILFTDEPLNNTTTDWNLIPVDNSTNLFRIRNVYHEHYLTIQDYWATSYAEGVGNFSDFVWKLEDSSNNGVFLIHNSSNLCMSEEHLETWIGDYYVPILNETCTDSWFEITCL